MSDVILRAKGIRKSYAQGISELGILKGLDVEIKRGEAVCIVGASGAGKSTLLHILGTLDHPSEGEVFFEDDNLFAKSEEELALFRSAKMGFVFQFHHLLAEFTAVENVMMPCRIAGESKAAAKAKALHLLETLGLRDRADHFPSQLSGGELQRVAIARALVRRPQVLFADEPTGNLDSKNSQMIQKLFFQLKEQYGLTLVVVTHDAGFAQKFSRVLRISDGGWAQNSF
ncbi:MAG: ABC transporter ATP-binding protein [Bdellovibrionaceae bacterium]|nr:ABC transporter ATP-binding protein [Pseudobdellovibrionaceae bacterium]